MNRNENPINDLMRAFVSVLLTNFPLQIPLALNGVFTDVVFTPESALTLALAAYASIISMPFPIMEMMGGVLQFAYNSQAALPEMFTAQAVTDRFKRTSAKFSPTFSAALTPELITLAAQLMLTDLLMINPNPSESQIKQDSQHYLIMAIEYLGIELDADAATSEAHSFLDTLPPDLKAQFEAFQRTGKDDPFSSFIDGLKSLDEE